MSDFEMIYQQYSKTVYFFLLSISHDEHLAEELTQETMFRAIMNIDSFREESKLLVWLCQIAKNLYYEYCRKKKRSVELNESVFGMSDGLDIAAEMADADMARRILKCVHKLEEPYKEVFMLHVLGDLPLKQISQLFEKSESWARVTYYRAKAMIVERLEGNL